MKRLLRAFLLSVRIIPFVVLQSTAQESGAEVLHADLDGDGVVDTISLSTRQDEYDVYTGYTLSVNGRTFSAAAPDVYEVQISIVDIDKRDSLQEVSVTTSESSDQVRVAIYMLEGTRIQPMPILPGMVAYRGDGVAATTNWMGFWSMIEEFRIDRAQKKWYPIPRDTYDVGVSGTVIKSFPLYESRDEKSKVAARVRPKSSIEIISCDPSPQCGDVKETGKGAMKERVKETQEDSGECDWYLIRSSNGTGWARLKEFKEKARIPWAG